MPNTTIDRNTLPNQLEAWIKPFENIGVSAELLKASFEQQAPRSFVNLYENCSRLLRENKFLAGGSCQITARWQLVALTGELDVLKNFNCATHTLQHLTDDLGAGLIYYLAFSGSAPAIQYVLKICPELKESQDWYGRNLLHYAALSGSVPAIKYVLAICPELKASQARDGRNLLHFAALSGSVPAIEYVLAICPELKDSQDKYGRNLLHLAAFSG